MAILNTPMALDSSLAELKKKAEIENAYLSVIASGGRQTVYSSISQIANVIRNGTVEANKRVFPIGDEIVVDRMSESDGTTVVGSQTMVIVHHDYVELSDGSIVPGMFLMSLDLMYADHDPYLRLPSDFLRECGSIKICTVGGTPAYEKIFYPSCTNWNIEPPVSSVDYSSEGPTFEYWVRSIGSEPMSKDQTNSAFIASYNNSGTQYSLRTMYNDADHVKISVDGAVIHGPTRYYRRICCCIC